MAWCRICGLTLLFLFLTSHSIHAYERDVHYDLTKHLARWAGFSESEAEQVATADQEIDAKPEFNPLPNPNFCPELRKIAGPASAIVAIPVACKNDPEFQRMVTAQRAYHFVDSERLQALRESAFQGRNLKILGHYLHALQDTFAHSLMDYADLPSLDKLVANLGRLPDEKVVGHLLYGHSLDETYERPDLAEHMAQYVYAELTRFEGSVNRWNEIDAAVARFAREKDGQRQLRYLAALPVPESAQALSQSEGSTEPAKQPHVRSAQLAQQQRVVAQQQAQTQRPAQSQQIEQVIATLIQEGTSSNPFASIRIGRTPDEVARQYIEAFKARDIITLVAMNHGGALEDIARIKRDYFAASWEHHLKKWAQGVVKSFLTLFDEIPKNVPTSWDRCSDFKRTCWDPPEFIAVDSLTYEIEILDMKRDEDVVEVPVKVRYPPGSLISRSRQGWGSAIKEARIYINIEISNNSVLRFQVGKVTKYDKP